MKFCCSRFLHLSNTYRPNNTASEFFRFCSWIRRHIQIFLTFGGDLVDAESHSSSTESTPSETPRQLSQRRVRLHINWVNAEWDSTSTESTRNDKIFVNVGVFCFDSVDVDSVDKRVWLCVDSVWGRWIKQKQACISSSGAFKGIVFIKINNEMFKWCPCQPENVNSFYTARSKKLTLR
jgi:hypothetical protein